MVSERVELVGACKAIARLAHGKTCGKYDSSGPYVDVHVAHVAAGAYRLAPLYNRDKYLCEAVGWLHDVPEDTAWSIDDIEGQLTSWGIDAVLRRPVLRGVALMTKPAGPVDLVEYYQAIADDAVDPVVWGSGMAQVAKLADIFKNLRGLHALRSSGRCSEADALRMSMKYSLGLDMLL